MAEQGHRRERIVIDRATGAVTHTMTPVLPDASFGERVAGLRLSVADAGPPLVRMLRLQCNGCGLVTELDYDQPEYPQGWDERGDGDFCPACTER